MKERRIQLGEILCLLNQAILSSLFLTLVQRPVSLGCACSFFGEDSKGCGVMNLWKLSAEILGFKPVS
jgi:hypothetical protein